VEKSREILTDILRIPLKIRASQLRSRKL